MLDTSTDSFSLATLHDTSQFAQQFVELLLPGDQIYLRGDLGAGKTTFTRACLRALGVEGSITSPTYALIEPYQLPERDLQLIHADLYRLSDPEELEYLDVRELFSEHTIGWIEWPDRGMGFLPNATIEITLQHGADADARQLDIKIDTERLGRLRAQYSD